MFFFDEEALIAEYSELPEGEPVGEILSLLARGAERPELTSSVPPDLEVADVEEAGESYFVELGPGFWDMTRTKVRRAAAQITYSLATLEEGKQLTLLDDGVPGFVPNGSGGELEQPMSVEDFASAQPWILVEQPVAGSLVADPMPVSAVLRGGGGALVEVVADDRVVGSGDTTTPVDWDWSSGPALVRFSARIEGSPHLVEVPVVLSGR